MMFYVSLEYWSFKHSNSDLIGLISLSFHDLKFR